MNIVISGIHHYQKKYYFHKGIIKIGSTLLFLVPGGTYFHLKPSHAMHAQESKYWNQLK